MELRRDRGQQAFFATCVSETPVTKTSKHKNVCLLLLSAFLRGLGCFVIEGFCRCGFFFLPCACLVVHWCYLQYCHWAFTALPSLSHGGAMPLIRNARASTSG
jgi:hypothetical protein